MLSASRSYHGVLRGSLEAVLAEAQGAEVVGPDGQPFNHYQSLIDTLNALRNNAGTIRDILAQIRARGDYRTVEELSRSLRPLLDLARDREAFFSWRANAGGRSHRHCSCESVPHQPVRGIVAG